MESLKNYIKSLQAGQSGDLKKAEELLCHSLGIAELTPYMKQNLSKLVDIENPNDAILTITTKEK